ncbi:Cytochrome b561, eukaryote [Cordyceps fumosorosea ARSEF 2679]|uniref:Cytochrome b561, eukaryote n=1 Tax=Cordyceps fumosorosea (strain ARSEF 2679) TaxID=1081104 RepID=A0A167R1M7_CORFA|nr:Cytochrome b561, eukaryote [Cordyceps fumosorosea ARSEF 2679]OAA58185.1 Cytochrome b561, eukaryote [Cordyceps fumosorosea ARSEF 2679]
MAPSNTALSQDAPARRRGQTAEADEPAPDRNTPPRQQDDAFTMAQLWSGAGFIAQAAVVTFALSLSGRVLSQPLSLFSWHPLSQVFGLFLLVQSILVLQPTRTAAQRRVGQCVHAWLNAASLVAFAAGFTAVYANKQRNGAPHFASNHGALGATLTTLLGGQYLVGFAMWVVPALRGRVWRLHRAAGYVSLLLLLATFCTAADTGFVRNVLRIEAWVFYAPMALVAVGVLPRIQLSKLGFKKRKV